MALDGTFYQKSGIISGGSHDLARKAKRWDEKHMAQLKLQKEKLTEDMKEVVKKSRKGSELATVESQIKVKSIWKIVGSLEFTYYRKLYKEYYNVWISVYRVWKIV